MTEKQSSLYKIAIIYTKLEQGTSEQKIREYLELEDYEFSSYVEFALENNWITEENGRYTISNNAKELINKL